MALLKEVCHCGMVFETLLAARESFFFFADFRSRWRTLSSFPRAMFTSTLPCVSHDNNGLETPEVKDGFRVEVLVDRNMVEVFVNDGEYVITNAVYGLGHSVAGNGAGNVRLYTVEAE